MKQISIGAICPETINKEDLLYLYPYLKQYSDKFDIDIKKNSKKTNIRIRTEDGSILPLLRIGKDKRLQELLSTSYYNEIFNFLNKQFGNDRLYETVSNLDFREIAKSVKITGVKYQDMEDYFYEISMRLEYGKYTKEPVIRFEKRTGYNLIKIKDIPLSIKKLLSFNSDNLSELLKEYIVSKMEELSISYTSCLYLFMDVFFKKTPKAIKECIEYPTQTLEACIKGDDFIFLAGLQAPHNRYDKLQISVSIKNGNIYLNRGKDSIVYNFAEREATSVRCEQKKYNAYKKMITEINKKEKKINKYITSVEKRYPVTIKCKIKNKKRKTIDDCFVYTISSRYTDDISKEFPVSVEVEQILSEIRDFTEEILKEVIQKHEKRIVFLNKLIGPDAKYDIGKSLLTLEILDFCNLNKRTAVEKQIVNALRGLTINPYIKTTDGCGKFNLIPSAVISSTIQEMCERGFIRKETHEFDYGYYTIYIPVGNFESDNIKSEIKLKKNTHKNYEEYNSFNWKIFIETENFNNYTEKQWNKIMPMFNNEEILCVYKNEIIDLLKNAPHSVISYLKTFYKIETGTKRKVLKEILKAFAN